MAFKSYEDTGHYHKLRPGRDHERFFIGQNPQDHDVAAGRRNKYEITINDAFSSPIDKDVRLERKNGLRQMLKESEGYIILLKFKENSDLSEFIHVAQLNSRIIETHGGFVIGYAESNMIRVYEEQAGVSSRHHWNKPAACLLWFRSLKGAMSWFETGKVIKQPDFPNLNPYQLVVVPLRHRSPDGTPFNTEMLLSRSLTMLWTEYPIFREDDSSIQRALQDFSQVASKCIRELGGAPFVATSRYLAVQPYSSPTPRVACTFKRSWIEPGTVLAVSFLPSMDSVEMFYKNESVQKAIFRQYKYIMGTTVAMTFMNFDRQ